MATPIAPTPELTGKAAERFLQDMKNPKKISKEKREQIKKNAAKETYPGLTYEYMRDYIILHTAPEDELEAVAEFDELILISKCQAKGKRYPTIKKWFLAKYPEIVKFGMPTLGAEESENEAQAPASKGLAA